MKIVEINGTNYSSTGNIMLNIAKEARKQGIEVFTCSKDSRKTREFNYDNHIYIGSRFERVISEELGALTGLKDSFNIIGTKRFIKKLKEIKPDLVHLHVMHDSFINYSLLFKYLKEENIPVVWTFHDCNPITGQCVYFDLIKCDKWKNGCNNCTQLHRYPESYLFDKTNYLWNKKRKLFNELKNLTIVTPSNWLANNVKESFLKDKEIKVINNGIDLSIFKPMESDFKEKYNLQDKKIILGVGYIWNKRKGFDDFIKLANTLPNDYKIVLVGTNDEVDRILPSNIISIHRTYNQEELVKIYSAADVFVNPTYEDNLPTTNIESLACGTPVITYDTGGSSELLDDKSGVVITKGDIERLEKEIERVCSNKPFLKEDCIKRAKQFSNNDKYLEYINLFKSLI